MVQSNYVLSGGFIKAERETIFWRWISHISPASRFKRCVYTVVAAQYEQHANEYNDLLKTAPNETSSF